MRKLSLLIAFALLTATGYAKQINETQAAAIAGKYLQTASRTLKALPSSNTAQNDAEYYIFNAGADNGFVIISGDDELSELVGYSENGSFSTMNMPENISYWLEEYSNYVKNFRAGKVEAKNIKYAAATPVVRPLLTTKWNQKEPYNTLCPGDRYRGICPTGCVATAMAQIMNYWQWPKTGQGVHSYRNDFRIETVDFSQSNYDWDNMLDEYLYVKNASGFIVEGWTKEQGDAVAKLMYDCGVATNMRYEYNGSGTTDPEAKTALAKHFKYDCQQYPRESLNTPQFMNLITTELDNARPLYFSGAGDGGGHAFVCDGYDSNEFLHINWGWGGMSDGYFNVNYMNPGSLGTGGGAGGFNHDQVITLMQPNKNGTPTTNDDYLGILPEGYINNFTGYIKAIDQKAKKGEPMRIAIMGIWNYTEKSYTGDVAFAVYNKEGERLTTPTNKEQMVIESGYVTDTESIIALGKEMTALTDGEYYVYAVSKQQNSTKETEWLRMATPMHLALQISGEEMSFVEENLYLEAVSPITANTKTFKTGMNVSFFVTVNNPTTQLADGTIALAIKDEQSTYAKVSFPVSFLAYEHSSVPLTFNVHLGNWFKAGKTYRCTMGEQADMMEGRPFQVNTNPEYELVFTMVDPAGVEDMEAAQNINIYPNPTADVANIQTSDTVIAVKLFTADGRLVQETTDTRIDMTACPAGYYLIRVETENGIFNKQIIKK